MNQFEKLIYNLPTIESKLGYHFKDRSLLILAFVHRSYINEHKEVKEHNERLEFLGDSILGMLMATYLYKSFPTTPEGELSSLRSRLVESSSCVSYIQSLDIAPFILLGKGEKMNESGRARESILADLFEAIIAAIYLDGGIQATENFVFNNFQKHIDAILEKPVKNWKAMLQDLCQKKYQVTPIYKVELESGPEHSKAFIISVIIDHQELGRGEGSSKKEAQQMAAKAALNFFKVFE